MKANRPLALCVLSIVLGCASSGGGTRPAARNLITAEDLQQSGYSTLYEYLRDHPRLIFAYSPQSGREEIHIRGRGVQSGTTGGAMLVLDGSPHFDPIAVLRDLQVEHVATVRILNPSEAGSRYGIGAGEGVIEVTTL